MDKITTPMAVLISGILIAYVIYSKPVPRYEFRGDSKRLNIRLDKITGETCAVHNFKDRFDKSLKRIKKNSDYEVCED